MEAGSISLAAKGSAGITTGGSLNTIATGQITEQIVNLSIPPALAARKTTATFGDIDFNTANFGIGNFNVDIGPMIPGEPGGTAFLKGGNSLSMTPLSFSVTQLVGSSSLVMAPAGITLTYGASSISITAAGVSILGPTVSIGSAATLQTTVEGVLVNSKASGINTIEGALVKLN